MIYLSFDIKYNYNDYLEHTYFGINGMFEAGNGTFPWNFLLNFNGVFDFILPINIFKKLVTWIKII